MQASRLWMAVNPDGKAIKAFREGVGPKMEAGEMLMKEGKLREAITLFQEVVDAFPGTDYEWRSLIMLGTVYSHLCDEERRLFYYAQAVAKFPEEGPDAYCHLVTALCNNKRYEEALSYVEIVLGKWKHQISRDWLASSLYWAALCHDQIRLHQKNWDDFRAHSRASYEYYKELLATCPESKYAKEASRRVTQRRRVLYEAPKN